MEQPGVVAAAGNFAMSFSLIYLSSFEHISGSIRPITLIQASLERSFAPAKVEYIDDANFGQKWCQKWKKGQGSSRTVMGGIGVNGLKCIWQTFFNCAINLHEVLIRIAKTYFDSAFREPGASIFTSSRVQNRKTKTGDWEWLWFFPSFVLFNI